MNYDGITNIWINLKDLSIFPYNGDDLMTINHLKCKSGYCFLSRSKTIKNISLKYCIDLQLNQILNKSLHNINIDDIILCKLPFWDNYVPAKILSINDKLTYGYEESWLSDDSTIDNYKLNDSFGSGTFNLYFPSCPDSDIYLTWHSGNKIVRERSMLTYKNIFQVKNEHLNTTNEHLSKIDNTAPFCLNDSDDEEINNCIGDMITEVIEIVKPKIILHSGLFEKKDNIKSELLRYHLTWLNNNENYITISKKSINISHNNISQTFLSNVAVINEHQLKNIIKLQCQNNYGMKIINKNIFKLANQDNLEPQNIKFFKKYYDNTPFINNKTYLYTYTGILCENAKKYLFNTNKIDIK